MPKLQHLIGTNCKVFLKNRKTESLLEEYKDHKIFKGLYIDCNSDCYLKNFSIDYKHCHIVNLEHIKRMCNNNMCLKSTTKSADILSISLSDVIIKVPLKRK